MKVYEISENQKRHFYNRRMFATYRMIIILALVMIPLMGFMIYYAYKIGNYIEFKYFITSSISIIPILLFMYLMGRMFAKILTHYTIIEITPLGIKKYVDNSDLNWIQKFWIENAKNKPDDFEIELNYQDITTIEEKKNDVSY